jgi:[ribosomal protein S5]-alanine N-acetyltransferase
VILRPMQPSDRDAWVRAFVASRDFLAPWTPASDALPEELFATQLDRQRSGSALKCVAVEGGEIAGWFNLNDIVRGASHHANAGWSVNAAFAGRGVATVGVGALLDLAFGEAALHRVACGIMPRNARSLRVAEKCGFRREGYAPEMLRIAGVWEDHVLLAKLAREHAR